MTFFHIFPHFSLFSLIFPHFPLIFLHFFFIFFSHFFLHFPSFFPHFSSFFLIFPSFFLIFSSFSSHFSSFSPFFPVIPAVEVMTFPRDEADLSWEKLWLFLSGTAIKPPKKKEKKKKAGKKGKKFPFFGKTHGIPPRLQRENPGIPCRRD